MSLPSLRDALPVFLETRAQIRGRRATRGIPGRDHDVDRRQVVLVRAKRLARKPLDDIARDSATEGARCDGQTQPRTVFIVGQYGQTKIGVGEFFAALPHGTEFRGLVQTLARLEGQSLA